MRKLSALLILLTLSVYALSAATPSIQPLKSTVDGRIFCTAFSINEQKGYWATAMHCIRSESGALDLPLIGEAGDPTKMVAIFPDVDMAVISGDLKAPALALAAIEPHRGDPVSVTGFGWGFNPPTTFWGKFSNIVHIETRSYAIFDMAVWPGHSGSPIVNAAGAVISVTQISADGIAGGSTHEDLVKRLAKYWGE